MGRYIYLLFLVFIIAAVASGPALAEMSEGEAEQKATEVHNLATKDVIFIDEELKALYYQNIQIIGLLRDIKQLLGKTLNGLEASMQRLEELEQKDR